MSAEQIMQHDLAKRPDVTATGGALTFHNIESLQRLTQYLHASRMLLKQYDTPEKIGTGIQYAVQLGFRDTWLLALRQIAVINGTPSMFGDLPLALVRSSGQLEVFEEFLVDKEGKRICLENKNISVEFYAAVCRLKRKGYEESPPVFFTVDDAKKAGVWGKNVWLVYPKRMIQMRTRSIALKDNFADILNGMSIGEYDHNTVIERVVESEVTDAPTEGLTGSAKLAALATASAPKVFEPEVLPPETVEEAPAADPGGEFAQFCETGEVKS